MSENWEKPTIFYKIIDEIGNNRLFSFIYMHYIKTLGLRGNENLLDFGSGSGAGSKHLAKILKEKGGHLTCVDTSRYWTSVAEKRMRDYNHVSFYTKPLPDLNFSTGSFDIIYIFYALHDVSEDLRYDIVKEFYKILKPKGRLYIKEPQRANDGMPVTEIRKLMSLNGFKEKYGEKKKGAFFGIYEKK